MKRSGNPRKMINAVVTQWVTAPAHIATITLIGIIVLLINNVASALPSPRKSHCNHMIIMMIAVNAGNRHLNASKALVLKAIPSYIIQKRFHYMDTGVL